MLTSFGDNLRIAIIGASGGIGSTMVATLSAAENVQTIYALSRQAQDFPSPKTVSLPCDLTDEASLKSCTEKIRDDGPLDIVIITTGFLHSGEITPEKNLRALSYEGFETNFAINTVGPTMAAKYFLPLMNRERKAVFAALSARVGSISDNRLGGWYAYRASKAALNMVIKTLAIEYARRFKNIVILGLHPGTVDTALSQPFQNNVPDGKLFTPEFSAAKLLVVIDRASPDDSGHLLDWAGKTVPF